jgi:hypothetical protein
MEKKMKKDLDKYSGTTVIFLTAAVMFVATPLIFGIGEFATAAFVVAGMACTIMGSFVVMFSGNESMDPLIVGLLPIQGCLNLCRISSDAGITGTAYFLPPRFSGKTRIMQFNPVSKYHGSSVSAGGSFTDREPHGLITFPTSSPLMEYLRKRNAVVIPDTVEELGILFNEAISDVFEFATKVTTTSTDGRVTVTLHNYHFIDGCIIAHSESPECCMRYPCPACSLCGTMLVECTNKVVSLESCRVTSSKDITAVFSFN